ncbi:hypothetical protein [Arthrobacter sp. H-02-3]|uniref:hypothetical protein n=1 Tax=Arthrobacter sp. H-02-3 TaxID=2703675 RepID=UPI000DD2AFB8|nr:hypothetical protein [Arthrobacter sp. H-02-3]PVZ60884.1 hypothetical protein C9424_00325 [Arthrobacter sp. H-02-3]
MNHHGDPNVEAAVRTAGLIAALTYIDHVGFHGIATSLTGASPRIDRSWPGSIGNARTAVAAIDWPNEIQTLAERFAAAAQRLASALDQRDISVTAEPAQELHVAYHALSDAGWAYLAKAAGIPEEGMTAHHHEHDTPPSAL